MLKNYKNCEFNNFHIVVTSKNQGFQRSLPQKRVLRIFCLVKQLHFTSVTWHIIVHVEDSSVITFATLPHTRGMQNQGFLRSLHQKWVTWTFCLEQHYYFISLISFYDMISNSSVITFATYSWPPKPGFLRSLPQKWVYLNILPGTENSFHSFSCAKTQHFNILDLKIQRFWKFLPQKWTRTLEHIAAWHNNFISLLWHDFMVKDSSDCLPGFDSCFPLLLALSSDTWC